LTDTHAELTSKHSDLKKRFSERELAIAQTNEALTAATAKVERKREKFTALRTELESF
jgi:hypothetical protein